jgi:hypothetical protein
MLILKCFFTIFYMLYTKNLPLKSLYLFKEQQQCPLGSFDDLSIHRDRQREAILFYAML